MPSAHYYRHCCRHSDYNDLPNDVRHPGYRFAALVDGGGGTLPLPAHQPLQTLQVEQRLQPCDVVLHHREVLVLDGAAHLPT